MGSPGPKITEADVAVTTSLSLDDEVVSRARVTADELGCPFLDRGDRALREVKAESGKDYLIVFTAADVRFVIPDQTFWFHPNMARSRIESLVRGEPDRLATFAGLEEGDRVLDATCGLGADATVFAHIVGKVGSVRAVEKSAVLASVVRAGMQSYLHRTPEVVAAMRRIDVVTADSVQYLAGLPDRSWDVVYFDPMFSSTLDRSQGIELVRWLACQDSVKPDLIAEARRVSERTVVMKDTHPGSALERAGFEEISIAGRVRYGRFIV